MKGKKSGRKAIIILAAAITFFAVFAVTFLFEASVKSETIADFIPKALLRPTTKADFR